MIEASQSLDQQPLHEPLTDERLGDLLSAVGNHEGKALLTLALGHSKDGEVFGRTALHKLITNLPGSKNAYIGDLGNQITWCMGSLEPIGLVAKAEFGETLRFGISDEGRQYGVPLAELLLEIGDRYDVALHNLFGSTHSPGLQRSPLTRFLIIQELLTSPKGVSYTDVIEAINSTNNYSHKYAVNIENHLKMLANANLINFDSWDPSEPIQYGLLAKPYKPTVRASALRLTAYEYLQSHESATIEELTDYYFLKNPGDNDQTAVSDIIDKLRVSLHGLEKKGYITRRGRMGAGDIGHLALNEEQRVFWTEVIDLLEKFKTQDEAFITGLLERAPYSLVDAGLIDRALNRAAESSPELQNGSEKNVGRLVLTVLEEEPQTIREIMRRITAMHGRSVSKVAVTHALKDLEREARAAGSTHNQNTLKYVRLHT